MANHSILNNEYRGRTYGLDYSLFSNSEETQESVLAITEIYIDGVPYKIDSDMIANQPNKYSAADNGKVVSGNELVEQTKIAINQNGIVDTTYINEVTVNVSSDNYSYAEDTLF